jgi:protein-S-isoprenylcysteine O-methyltransferase Ste14
MANDPLPNVGVYFPPPLVYVIGLVLGYGFNRWMPLWIAAPEPSWVFMGGLAIAVAGFLFGISGALTFRRKGTAIVPNKPASMIVSAGPYAITRNPMYLGLAVCYAGCSLVLDTWWAVGLLPVVVVIIDRQVIAREERYLGSAFGEEYEAYRAKVRRWI